MTTQVLIVHGQLPFAIKLKQTLERSASFEVHPFTSVEAALEYLTDHLQDVAVVDFTIVEHSGEQIIQHLRGVQPNIAIIAAPKLESGKTRALGLAGSLPAGFTAQDLIKAINDHFARNQRPSVESPGTTALLSRLGKNPVPSTPSNSDILPEYSNLDDVLNAGGTNIFDEPPVVAGDTPSNPPEELDWVDESSKRESLFDEVLNQLPPDAPKQDEPKKGTGPFNDLVNSMRTEETHRPLPSRQQQLVEFILSGGTESLDNEPPKPPMPQRPEVTPLAKQDRPETAPLPPADPAQPVQPPEEPPLEPPDEPPDWEISSELSEWLTSNDDPDLFASKPRTVEPEPMPDWFASTGLPDALMDSEPEEEQAPDWFVSTASLEGLVPEAEQQDAEPMPDWLTSDDESGVEESEFSPDSFAPTDHLDRPEPPDFSPEMEDRPETAPLPSMQPEPEPPQAVEEAPRSPLLSAFDRLSKDEPPAPDFEENGTVSDLVEGVQDRSFRNVLSILSGDEGEGAPPDDIAQALPSDFDVGPRRSPGKSRRSDDFLFDDEDRQTPARIILQQTLERTMAGGTFSLEELLENIDAQLPLHRPNVQPLPSWTSKQAAVQDDAFLVREPEFLPEEMPEDLPDEATPVEPSEDLYADQTTIASRGQQIEAHPEMLETEWIERTPPAAGETYDFPDTLPEEMPADATVVHQSLDATVVHGAVDAEDGEDEAFADESPVPELYTWDEAFPEETPASGARPVDDQDYVGEMPVIEDDDAGDTSALWYDLPEQDFNTQFEMMAAFEVHGETGYASGALYTETSVEPAAELPEPVPEPVYSEDDYIAQMALSLTDASLEMTAEASLLARDRQIVAYTGRMPEAEIEELRDTIADDWDAAPGEARIRFITAPGSGKDYMLYSRRTEADFTLSLIFAGTTPLRDIRRQGKRLVDALTSVPEAPATIPEAPAPVAVEVDDTTRTPYACVWLLRDPSAHLDSAASQAVTAGLNVQMREQGWTIRSLQVHEDFVYLLADVPGEEPAYKIMRELKRRSAALAHAQNAAYTDNGLWADGYLVVTPGRDLDVEEIQQFINFERTE